MDHRDEQLVCSDCGESFVFTAAEAAFYEERGLRAPPKRCKACRAARKTAGPRRSGAPRYTGDVNEYRSPMQDTSYSSPSGGRRDGRGRNDGNYRAPSFGGGLGSGRAPSGGEGSGRSRSERPPGRGRGRGDPRPARTGPPPGGRPALGRGETSGPEDTAAPVAGSGRRARRHRALFDITCSACGVAAQVPFEPAEGREVFCKECYVARKPVASEGSS
jgi:CxxC-x17-CxxC domain-containing protein